MSIIRVSRLAATADVKMRRDEDDQSGGLSYSRLAVRIRLRNLELTRVCEMVIAKHRANEETT